MSENNKELQQKELENVNGGNIVTDPSNLVWQYDLGRIVTVTNDANSWEKYEGQVTKLGYTHALVFYATYYYVDCGNANFNGWYCEEDIAAQYTNNLRRVNTENSASIVVVKE